MSNVAIITDTIGCLTPEQIKQNDIYIVSHRLTIDKKTYRDMYDITAEDFWQKHFYKMKVFLTGVPPISDFVDMYKKIARKTDKVVCIHVSGALTGMCEVAKEAKDMYAEDNPKFQVEIIDTKNAAGAEGFIVIEAARAAAAGKRMEEVTKVARDMIPRVKMLVAFDTLKYLIRSGRAPKVAYMGELMQVKPIVGMVNCSGIVENLGRARGKEKAWQRVVEMMDDYVDTTKPLHINVHYTASREDGEKFRDLITSTYKCSEVHMSVYSPIMAGHTGPLTSVTFYS